VLKKMEAMSNAEVLCVDYNAMLTGAGDSITQINKLLGGDLTRRPWPAPSTSRCIGSENSAAGSAALLGNSYFDPPP